LAVTRVGVRQLRADLAASLRRASAGEPLDITVDGRVVARLGPVTAGRDDASTLAALVAAGALIAPRRGDRQIADGAISVFRNVRLDLLLREIRG
jgi:antitoxin (DNA-binding transcriptional repressor) of toxin-antitoxin stability system